MDQIFPRFSTVFWLAFNILTGGVFSNTVDALQQFSGYGKQNGNALDDSFGFAMVLDSGTYLLSCVTGAAQGIVSVWVDGALKGTLDLYNAATTRNVFKNLAGIVLTSPGLHHFEFRMSSKNASSSAYGWQITSVTIVLAAG